MPRVALLFPGQGSQFVGMGKALWEHNEEVQALFANAGRILDLDMVKLCFESQPKTLTETHNAQIAIFLCSVASYQVYMKEIGIKPVFAAGHSLGELSALCCSGVIDFEDALRIVRQRGLLMHQAVPPGIGKMAAVIGLVSATIEEVCRSISSDDEPVGVANLNTPKQTVISGTVAGVEKACAELESLGGRIVFLDVAGPFHCPLMQPAADRFNGVLREVAMRDFSYPVVSNVSAFLYRKPASVPEMLVSQLVSPVRWHDTIQFLRNQNMDLFVEVGPKAKIKRMLKDSGIEQNVYATDEPDDMAALRSFKQDCFRSVITKCLAAAVCTPNANDNVDEYKVGVVEPYKQIERLHNELDESKRQPTVSEMLDALRLLRTIFATKKVSANEQAERFDLIYDQTGTRELFESKL